MIRALLSSFLICCFPLFSEESNLYPIFSPPKNWEVAKPDSLAPKVKIGFFGKAKGYFPPSINLAVEPTEADLNAYLKAVQKLYSADKDKRWRNLGSFSTKAGPAVLTSLDFSVDEDQVRVLQLILIKNKKAYLLTGASAKAECAKNQKVLLDSFSSLDLLSDISNSIKDPSKKELLHQRTKDLLLSPETGWSEFQSFLLKEFKNQGICWQILFLDFLKDQIRKNPS